MPAGLSSPAAVSMATRGCARLVDEPKVVRGVEECPLRLVEDNHRAIEADQKVLRGPIIPAHFHSFSDGTDGSSYLIEPLSAANAIPARKLVLETGMAGCGRTGGSVTVYGCGSKFAREDHERCAMG